MHCVNTHACPATWIDEPTSHTLDSLQGQLVDGALIVEPGAVVFVVVGLAEPFAACVA